ncbi:hypothetical protein VTL71DRAFT_9078 [Oculimacula yallundae]|uniref:Uncharacterized protein n=1 Tax=Oculimacula yallundae TaxID=86028 RepID=A0ABR4BUY4_9HELO
MQCDANEPLLRPLLVLGNKRTGCFLEHLLRFPDGLFPFEHALQTIQSAAPSADTIYISRDNWIKPPGERSAAGLLAAHALFPNTDWLVVELGFPLLEAPALQQLIDEHRGLTRCLMSAAGTLGPLLGVWTSEALEKLKLNMAAGLYAEDLLKRMFKSLSGKRVKPLMDE